MARLQILELPEGTNDDRPPFVLVIDQAPRDETSSAFREDLKNNEIAAGIGARHVLVFEDTIDIPVSGPPLLAEAEDPERAGTTQLVYAHERTRLDLCSALLLSGDTTWRQLIEAVAERQQTVVRVLNLPEQPAAVSADGDMADYLQGYGAGVRAAKRAARNEAPQSARGAP